VAADAWRQWAAFLAAAAGGQPAAAPGFSAFFDAERFAAAARAFQEGSRDPTAAAAAFGDFLRDQFGGMLGGIWGGSPRATPLSAEAPALGPTREQQERWQRATAAWQRLQETQRRLQRLWSDALGEAARAFVSRAGAAAAPLTPEAMHGLYDAWIDCAEEAYARMAHGEAFGTALAEALKATAECRDESLAMLESWAKWLDWPTRSEINSLSLRVRALEQQLRERRTAARPAAKKRTARGKGKR
jgi:hypothetical protein